VNREHVQYLDHNAPGVPYSQVVHSIHQLSTFMWQLRKLVTSYVQHCGPGTICVPYSPLVLMWYTVEEAINFL